MLDTLSHRPAASCIHENHGAFPAAQPSLPLMTSPHHDAFASLLSACKSERAVTACFDLHAPWALRSDGTEGLLIRVCSGAPYWMQVPGERLDAAQAPGEAVQVQPGEIVMLSRRMAHSIAANPGDWANAQAFADILPAHMEGPHGSHPLQMRHGGRGALTRLLTLHLWLSPLDADLVARQLPPWLLLRPQQQPLMASLGAAMELLVQDSLVQKPGWQLSAARMGDLLLLHLLGEHWRSQPAPDGSLADPGIARAVSAMQAEPQHPWTLQTLAQLACMSRTVFTGRFRQLLGVPPMQYLASYRMQRAAELLRRPQARVADVAEAVGYASDKAFGRAFERSMGVSPSQYLRQR